MDKETIIKLAREAGWAGVYTTYVYTTYNEPTGEADWKRVKESLTVPVTMEQIEVFAKLVAEHEREACAKVCEESTDHWVNRDCAAAIRERSANAGARGNT